MMKCYTDSIATQEKYKVIFFFTFTRKQMQGQWFISYAIEKMLVKYQSPGK